MVIFEARGGGGGAHGFRVDAFGTNEGTYSQGGGGYNYSAATNVFLNTVKYFGAPKVMIWQG